MKNTMSKPNKTPLIIAAISFQFGITFMLIGGYFDDQNKLMKEETKELIRQAYVDGYENGYVKGDWYEEINKFYEKHNL